MKARPIIFTGPMVRAILDNRKTQTRRAVKLPEHAPGYMACSPPVDGKWEFVRLRKNGDPSLQSAWRACPYGKPGDQLWVKETHVLVAGRCWPRLPYRKHPESDHVYCYYREGFDRSPPSRWRPSIYTPRWASRLTLEVTGVRVERVQDIGWEANPWVWVVEFRRMRLAGQ